LPVIRASGLTKTYLSKITGQPIRALGGADISVEPGEIFGILGPNGAGKTTLLNCLSLLLKPDEGSIELFGMDALKFHGRLRGRLNMSSGNSNFPWCMTVREVLRFYGMLYGIGFAAMRKKTDELLGLLALEP
jgi:ABC-type multidrug transport system ATPase subunit